MRPSDIAVSATGVLREFSEAGVLEIADVHPALHITYLFGERDERVQLALALAVRALRSGSMCVDLATVEVDAAPQPDDGPAPELSWPDSAEWPDALRASPCVTVGGDPSPTNRPLRLLGDCLYLERHWRDEETIRQTLDRLATTPARAVDLPPANPELDAAQRRAVATALRHRLSVIAGGPGTGKTRIISEIMAGARALDPGVMIGLAAPTGKAAARMKDSLTIENADASTIHRLLGWRPGSRNRFRHDRFNPLPHDLVVIDETSMVSATMMARLAEALKPTASLVLVGDPNQLASVEAGAVLANLTLAPGMSQMVATLSHNYRFAGAVVTLADAIRDGDADAALAVLASGDPNVRLYDQADGLEVVRSQAVSAGTRLWQAASRSEREVALAALDEHRLLCAHRTGRWGAEYWSNQIRSWLVDGIVGYAADGEFYVGRPLMVTRNSPDLGLFNGDTGVVLAPQGGSTVAVFGTGGGPRSYSPWAIDGLESVYAMTIHKSQGSQFARVSVVLPPVGSPLLTRELLYTAVTRASESVVILGSPDALVEAISRPTRRTSGLAGRL